MNWWKIAMVWKMPIKLSHLKNLQPDPNIKQDEQKSWTSKRPAPNLWHHQHKKQGNETRDQEDKKTLKNWTTCNGSSEHGQPMTMEETHASCLEETACQMPWTVTVALDSMATGCDVSDAFVEANWFNTRCHVKVEGKHVMCETRV